jgi:hypothetical protein
VYSDRSNELTNNSYATGFGSGVADASGIYRSAWVVPPTAPTGKATVHIITTGDPVEPTAIFTIVPQTGSCP